MINKRKIFFLLSLLFLSVGLKAQFGFWAGYMATAVKYGSFDQFRVSYNGVNAATMKKEMPAIGLSNGFSVGIEGHAKWFYGELSANFLKGETFAEFTNGEKREFQVKQNLISGGFGVGWDWKDKFYTYVIGGFSGGTMLINSSFIYIDGTRSFSTEKIVNGHSHGLSLGGYYGITGGIPVTKNIKVMLRVAHFGYSRADSKFALSDMFGSKVTAISGIPHPDGLPTDYASYLAAGYNYSGSYVGTDLGGWRFFVGLHYQFGGGYDD